MNQRFSTILSLAACFLCMISAGCASSAAAAGPTARPVAWHLDNHWPDAADKTHRALVTPTDTFNGEDDRDAANDGARLVAFVAAMLDVAGTDDLEKQFIGCLECQRLAAGPIPKTLTFIFIAEHRNDVQAFREAYSRVQASGHHVA